MAKQILKEVLEATDEQLANPEWVDRNLLIGTSGSPVGDATSTALRIRMFVAERRAFDQLVGVTRKYMICTIVIAAATVVNALIAVVAAIVAAR